MSVPLARAAAAALWVAAAAALFLALPAAASAAPEHTLTVNVIGEGSVGCRVQAPEEEFEECSSEASYPENTTLTLTVNPNQAEYEEQFGAYEYHEFAHWGGACAAREAHLTCTVKMTEDETVEAIFVGEPMAFTASIVGSGGGKVECEVYGSGIREAKCASKYRYETELVLYATPSAESEFVEWGPGCWVESEAECELTIEEDTAITAIFALEPLLSIALEGSGKAGSRVECEYEGVLEAECRKRYPLEAEVTLYPQAGPGAEFASWGGACVGAEEACEIQMAGPQSVTATFVLAPEEEGEEEPPPGEEEEEGEEEAGGEETPGGGGDGGGGSGGGGSSGGGSQSAAGSSPAPPATASPPRGAVAVARLASVRGSMAVLRLRCAGAAACAGTLELEAKLPALASPGGRRQTAASFVRIGGARFSLSPGGSATVRLRVRHAAVRYLARRGRLAASVAGSGVTPSAIVLKAAKKTVKHR